MNSRTLKEEKEEKCESKPFVKRTIEEEEK